MTYTPETVLGKKVLDLTTMRHQIISNNISNANTPNYKRVDLSFAETLGQMADKTRGVQANEVNTPPDLLTEQLIAADLSRGKELAFLHGKSDGDLGIDFSKNSISFDYQWYKGGADMGFNYSTKNLSQSDVINETSPILIKTKNSERLDGNNVNVDLEVAEMIKNTSYYNMITSIVSGDFRIYRTIISAR
jgi:flagellar basal body rod protein FlgB